MILETLALIGFFFLAMLSVAAIVDVVQEHMSSADSIDIVDPQVSAELERIATQRGSKKHKRFAYDRVSKKAVLVESNRIADELKDADVVTIDMK